MSRFSALGAPLKRFQVFSHGENACTATAGVHDWLVGLALCRSFGAMCLGFDVAPCKAEFVVLAKSTRSARNVVIRYVVAIQSAAIGGLSVSDPWLGGRLHERSAVE